MSFTLGAGIPTTNAAWLCSVSAGPQRRTRVRKLLGQSDVQAASMLHNLTAGLSPRVGTSFVNPRDFSFEAAQLISHRHLFVMPLPFEAAHENGRKHEITKSVRYGEPINTH